MKELFYNLNRLIDAYIDLLDAHLENLVLRTRLNLFKLRFKLFYNPKALNIRYKCYYYRTRVLKWFNDQYMLFLLRIGKAEMSELIALDDGLYTVIQRKDKK